MLFDRLSRWWSCKNESDRSRVQSPRIPPVPRKIGGVLPFLIPLLAGLSATGALTSGAAGTRVKKRVSDPRLSARRLARLFRAKSLAESLGSDYMHDSQRDSLQDSFFYAGIANAVNDFNSAKRAVDEGERHKETIEAIALGKGRNLQSYRKGLHLNNA